MDAFSPYDYDYSISVGEKYTRFALDKYHFGVLICFEATDPALARQYPTPGADGPAVDFLVNMSNDGWFDGSSEHEEHLAISRFRAPDISSRMLRSRLTRCASSPSEGSSSAFRLVSCTCKAASSVEPPSPRSRSVFSSPSIALSDSSRLLSRSSDRFSSACCSSTSTQAVA